MYEVAGALANQVSLGKALWGKEEEEKRDGRVSAGAEVC